VWRFDAGGALAGDEFQVNTTVAGSQMNPDLSTSRSGDIIVAWDCSLSIRGRAFRSTVFSDGF